MISNTKTSQNCRYEALAWPSSQKALVTSHHRLDLWRSSNWQLSLLLLEVFYYSQILLTHVVFPLTPKSPWMLTWGYNLLQLITDCIGHWLYLMDEFLHYEGYSLADELRSFGGQWTTEQCILALIQSQKSNGRALWQINNYLLWHIIWYNFYSCWTVTTGIWRM